MDRSDSSRWPAHYVFRGANQVDRYGVSAAWRSRSHRRTKDDLAQPMASAIFASRTRFILSQILGLFEGSPSVSLNMAATRYRPLQVTPLRGLWSSPVPSIRLCSMAIPVLRPSNTERRQGEFRDARRSLTQAARHHSGGRPCAVRLSVKPLGLPDNKVCADPDAI